MRETTKLRVEITNRKRQVKGKLGHVVSFDVNVVMLNVRGRQEEQDIVVVIAVVVMVV